MAERKRSHDGRRETEEVPPGRGEAPAAPAGQGRTGGRLSRDIGSRDELKRATERPAGATRVTKSDEDDEA